LWARPEQIGVVGEIEKCILHDQFCLGIEPVGALEMSLGLINMPGRLVIIPLIAPQQHIG